MLKVDRNVHPTEMLLSEKCYNTSVLSDLLSGQPQGIAATLSNLDKVKIVNITDDLLSGQPQGIAPTGYRHDIFIVM